MKAKVLCVDDELKVLEAYQRGLRRQFEIDVAKGGDSALSLLAEGKLYAVIVSDMRMPGMDGIQFLSKARLLAPRSVRIMLTGNSDERTAIQAVNEGNIFRYLTKPCSPEMLAKALNDGVRQYDLIAAEVELMEHTLQGSIQMLTDVFSLVNPAAFSCGSRLRPLARRLARELKAEDPWQVEVAAMVSQVGCIAVPEETINKAYTGQPLSEEEAQAFQAHPSVGHELIARIPRMQPVAKIVAYQEKLYSGSGSPEDGVKGQQIPLGARILKLLLDFDRLELSGLDKSKAYEEVQQRKGWYDPLCMDALRIALAEIKEYERVSIGANELTSEMWIAEDVVSRGGRITIKKGHPVTLAAKARLEHFAATRVIDKPIEALAPLGPGTDTKDTLVDCHSSR